MKICIIGNSHLAALKLAWDQLSADNKGTELVFFGARAKAMSHMAIQNECLIPTDENTLEDINFTSGGLGYIDVNKFDAIFLYGLACDFNVFSIPLKNHRLNGNNPAYKMMTSSCFTRACQDMIKESLIFKLATMVRQISDKPLFISPSPFPSETCIYDKSGKWDILEQVKPDGADIKKYYYNAIELVFKPLNAFILYQPNVTISEILFTKQEFSNGSIRMIKGFSSYHPKDDYAHMNKEYGIKFLTDALKKVSVHIPKAIPLLTVKDSISMVEYFQGSAHLEPKHIEIPRILFQYWDKNKRPDQIQTLLDRNKKLCEYHNVKYVFMNDDQAKDCIKKHFPEFVYKAYEISPHPAMKCDLFRLCHLYLYGGFYLDADMVLTEKFEELFAIKGQLAVFKWDIQNIVGICNWLIGSAPDLPIIEFAINVVANNIITECEKDIENALKNTLSVSGPALFSRIIGSFIAVQPTDELIKASYKIESVSYGLALVQNGPSFLKKSLEYKSTNLHWSIAAKNGIINP